MKASKSEERRRYRRKYPEKVRAEKVRYYERRLVKALKANSVLLGKYDARILFGFGLITRVMFDDVLPKRCELCGEISDLVIHHKRYVYPIERDDLMRLCKRCHQNEHSKATPPK